MLQNVWQNILFNKSLSMRSVVQFTVLIKRKICVSDPHWWRLECRHVWWHHGSWGTMHTWHFSQHLLYYPLCLWKLYPYRHHECICVCVFVCVCDVWLCMYVTIHIWVGVREWEKFMNIKIFNTSSSHPSKCLPGHCCWQFSRGRVSDFGTKGESRGEKEEEVAQVGVVVVLVKFIFINFVLH